MDGSAEVPNEACLIDAPQNSKAKRVAAELGLDIDTAQLLIDDFYANWESYKEAMKKAVASDSLEDLRSAAHAIKGASGSLRLDEICDIARELEEKAKSGESVACGPLLDSLVEAVET